MLSGSRSWSRRTRLQDSCSSQASLPLIRSDKRFRGPTCSAAGKDGTAKEAFGFGFSAGGLLFPYYLGITSSLQALGVLTHSTPVAGASAGSLIAACSKSGMSEEQLTSALLRMAAECRRLGTRHNLGPILRQTLHQELPDDIHERANSGNVHVAVTQVLPQMQPRLVSQFHSRDDLISALLTSCHIPWYFDGSLTTVFRGQHHFDGGLTRFLPVPPEAERPVRVCCFPSQQLRGLGPICITPDTFQAWPHDMGTMLSWAFEPAPEPILLQLIDKGKADAYAWAEREGLLEAQTEPALLQRQTVLVGTA